MPRLFVVYLFVVYLLVVYLHYHYHNRKVYLITQRPNLAFPCAAVCVYPEYASRSRIYNLTLAMNIGCATLF